MAETVTIDLEKNSKYRVAYDLMKDIAFTERDKEEQNREYRLRLYRQCYDAVNGIKAIDDVVSNKEYTEECVSGGSYQEQTYW